MSVPSDRPPISLIERQNDISDIEAMENELEIESPERMYNDKISMAGENFHIVEDEDGYVVDLDPQVDRDEDFYANLAEEMDMRDLGSVSSELTAEYDANKASRSEWEQAYSEGLELLGFSYEERTQPFRGSSGVTHPLLAEAATQFQAQAFNELLPPAGPVKTSILGTPTLEKEQQAKRVKDFRNTRQNSTKCCFICLWRDQPSKKFTMTRLWGVPSVSLYLQKI